MRLLLDERLSPAIARELGTRGHDVQAIQEHPEWCSFDDGQCSSPTTSSMRPLHYEAIAAAAPWVMAS